MTEKSKLIILGHGAAKVLYQGDGRLGQWQEKLSELGGLREQTYSITQIERTIGNLPFLRTINQGFIRNPTDGQYILLGANETLYHLNAQSKDMLLELINSVPEQSEARR